MVNKLVEFLGQALWGCQYQVSTLLGKHCAKPLVRLQVRSDVDHILRSDLNSARNETGTEQ